ncbi:MAG: HlyD family efflux transporter periplasmic adaptor subunit [Phycisphaerae bacterium]
MRTKPARFVALAVGCLAPLLITALIGFDQPRQHAEQQEDHAAAGKTELHEKADAAHGEETPSGAMVRVEREMQARLGLAIGTVKSERLAPEVTALGKLEADPSRSFAVRAAVSGVLRAEGNPWPMLGSSVADGAALGVIQPLPTPTELLELSKQIVESRAEVSEAEAELAAARASYESKHELNAQGKMVSDRQLEESESRVKSAEARLAAARRKLELFEQRRSDRANGLEPVPVTAARGGTVVELMATPDEFVDVGQPLLRVARFDRLIARVELPLGETWDAPPAAAARVSAIGDGRVVQATALGRCAQAGADTRGEAWLLVLRNEPTVLQPGTPVVAHLPKAGEPLTGVLVPDSAIIRYGGLAWVFVRTSDDAFQRCPVKLHSPTPDGWFLTEGISAEDSVVTRGAQVLLSEQLKQQIEAEAEAAE